jgi:phosphate regulon transcriptional regulator PhoB
VLFKVVRARTAKNMQMKVLVVDDEPPIVESVAYSLSKEGFNVLTASDGERCLELARTQSPDLIILDVMLPSANGFDICKTLRRAGTTPIIMLTARAEETDRVVGLELGADDYLTKPFSMRELMARVKSVLRRSTLHESPSQAELHVGELQIDTTRHESSIRGAGLQLYPKEFQLLHFLASHAGKVFTRQQLLDRVWGTESFVEERTIDVHIRWLREKIELDASCPKLLRTVRGVGYSYRDDE